MSSLIEAIGATRVLEPAGALPQAAVRLDAAPPVRPYEIELEVDTLCLDSTSFRQLADSNARDPVGIGDAILAIVADRGKMHNPVTGSGGILAGSVSAVGAAYPDPPALGLRVITLTSLTNTPLRLQAVGRLDPDSPHVPVTGTAYMASAVPWTAFPQDISLDAALAAVDVCNAASQTRELIDDDTRTVLVLGGGHAGLVALAAARDSLRPGSKLVLIDASQRICERARDLDLCDVAIRADLRDPIESLRGLEEAEVARADLTVVVVNSTDCEAAAILLTADHGTVLFFSMATSFTKAALGSDGLSSAARMLVGSGFAPDRGVYALELIGRDERLQRAIADT
jgi:L-erythro-3,5-diaminohexanoate dehydrogenase